MRDSKFPYLIAVDGGGTSCRFALQGPSGRLYVKGGSANVWTAPAAAAETLRSGLARLRAETGLSEEEFCQIPVYAGLAGLMDEAAARFVREHIRHEHVKAEPDWCPAVVGALGRRDGCLIGIGTGSFLARHAGGEVSRIGGYGLALGDEASGAWLGRGLLQRALHVLDGLEAETPLVGTVLEEFDRSPARIVQFARTAGPAEYGGYAPKIVAAAGAGDAGGVALMTSGAAYITSGLDALGRSKGEAVCALGGVAAQYAAFLPDEVAGSLVAPEGEALDGALELARRFAASLQEEQA